MDSPTRIRFTNRSECGPIEVVVASDNLLEIEQNGRYAIGLTREEAFDLLEKIETALQQMPTGLPSGGKEGR